MISLQTGEQANHWALLNETNRRRRITSRSVMAASHSLTCCISFVSAS